MAGGEEGEGDAVVDPFMGSGTILEAAAQTYGAGRLVGAEVEGEGFKLARERLRGAREMGVEVRLRRTSFEQLEDDEIPEGARLVSNLPFGVRFERVETARLVEWLRRVAPRLGARARLLARHLAAAAGAGRGGRRIKNVIVLGQPAAIVYATLLRM
jgi:23S rRNA G2445 N2-methylase RlmL